MKRLLIPFLPAISQSNTQRDSVSGQSTSALEQWTQAFIHSSGIEWKRMKRHRLSPLINQLQFHYNLSFEYKCSVWIHSQNQSHIHKPIYSMQKIVIFRMAKKKYIYILWDRQTTDTSAVKNYTENFSNNNNLKYPKIQIAMNIKLQASKTSNNKAIILCIEKQLNDTK